MDRISLESDSEYFYVALDAHWLKRQPPSRQKLCSVRYLPKYTLKHFLCKVQLRKR